LKDVSSETTSSSLTRVSQLLKWNKKRLFSEFVGTYILVLVGPSSVIVTSLFVHSPFIIPGIERLLLVALTFGGTVSALILILGKYSGAIINPAITIALASARVLKKEMLIPYLIFQIFGGIVAGLTLLILFGSIDTATSLGSTKLGGGISPITGIVLEAVGTSILSFSVLVASTRMKVARNQALFVGATLFALIAFIGPFTGAGFNPARSLGPSLASGYLNNLYVYFVGPILGGLFAGILFRGLQSGLIYVE
jgi:glycerol uptake facilitator